MRLFLLSTLTTRPKEVIKVPLDQPKSCVAHFKHETPFVIDLEIGKDDSTVTAAFNDGCSLIIKPRRNRPNVIEEITLLYHEYTLAVIHVDTVQKLVEGVTQPCVGEYAKILNHGFLLFESRNYKRSDVEMLQRAKVIADAADPIAEDLLKNRVPVSA